LFPNIYAGGGENALHSHAGEDQPNEDYVTLMIGWGKAIP
jgi:hypothetical protein